MARVPVKDSAGLAAMLLALRGFASGATPSNDFERAVFGGMRKSGANPKIAQTMVDNFDRLRPKVRRRALGEFSDPAFVPQLGRPLFRGSRPRSGLRMPRTFDFRPNVPQVGSTAPDSGGVYVDKPNTQASYTIKYVGFHCDQEVGDQGDVPGLNDTSEEVYSITSAVHTTPTGDNPPPRTEKHPFGFLEYDDVDVGETRLGPIAACWQGLASALPVSFTVVAYERDHGDPEKYREQVHNAVVTAVWIAKYFGVEVPDQVSDLLEDGINWLLDTDDEQVDIARTLILTQQHLERMGRKGRYMHWHSFTPPFGGETINFPTDLISHFTTAHAGMGGRYVFGFDVDRNPDFVEDPQGGVD